MNRYLCHPYMIEKRETPGRGKEPSFPPRKGRKSDEMSRHRKIDPSGIWIEENLSVFFSASGSQLAEGRFQLRLNLGVLPPTSVLHTRYQDCIVVCFVMHVSVLRNSWIRQFENGDVRT
jgi:hypothetical protein